MESQFRRRERIFSCKRGLSFLSAYEAFLRTQKQPLDKHSPKFLFKEDLQIIHLHTEENNCFSVIAQVIIKATAFSFILKTSSNLAAPNLKISVLVL